MCRHQALVQKPAEPFTDSSSSVKAVQRSVVSASNRQTSAGETVRGVAVSRNFRSIAGLFLMLGPLDHSLVRGAESMQERAGAFSVKEWQAPMRLQGWKPCPEARFSRL
jgi:hypothetical protein